VSYIYFTRIVVYLLEATLPYGSIWISAAASEIVTLMFYVASGWYFRPMAAGVNPYFALEGEELEMARQTL
jgi:G protein-coupled receptor 107